MNAIVEILLNHVVEIVFAILGVLLSTVVIPWLKDKRLYGVVKDFVKAAEKYAQTNDIDKKTWVLAQLEKAGVKINATVDALIEKAVYELDVEIINKVITDLPAAEEK